MFMPLLFVENISWKSFSLSESLTSNGSTWEGRYLYRVVCALVLGKTTDHPNVHSVSQ